jgi:hypothetical protein
VNGSAPQQQQQQQPSVAGCPLLPPVVKLPLCAADGSDITLQQLSGPNWWGVLPQHLQANWRRDAGGGKWLFTPTAADLELPAAAAGGSGSGDTSVAALAISGSRQRKQQQQQEEEQAEAVARCGLARVLFWARWRLGEPVIVRGAQVRKANSTPGGQDKIVCSSSAQACEGLSGLDAAVCRVAGSQWCWPDTDTLNRQPGRPRWLRMHSSQHMYTFC